MDLALDAFSADGGFDEHDNLRLPQHPDHWPETCNMLKIFKHFQQNRENGGFFERIASDLRNGYYVPKGLLAEVLFLSMDPIWPDPIPDEVKIAIGQELLGTKKLRDRRSRDYSSETYHARVCLTLAVLYDFFKQNKIPDPFNAATETLSASLSIPFGNLARWWSDWKKK